MVLFSWHEVVDGERQHCRSLGFLRISCQSLVASINLMQLSLWLKVRDNRGRSLR